MLRDCGVVYGILCARGARGSGTTWWIVKFVGTSLGVLWACLTVDLSIEGPLPNSERGLLAGGDGQGGDEPGGWLLTETRVTTVVNGEQG